ncbi:MAG: TIM barrel protein [Candidatus Omnitrophota bacterium]
MIIAAKCAPEKRYLSAIRKAGIRAVELYLPEKALNNPDKIIRICKGYAFRYAVHSPRNGLNIFRLSYLCEAINAEIAVFHNNYWEDEWQEIASGLKNIKVCIENIASADEPVKFMRRFGMGMCLDLEHLQMQCGGVYEEEFIRIAKQASHVHLTGYSHGSSNWHTHIHHDPQHGAFMLKMLKKAGYTGLVVSEAEARYQTYNDFLKLNKFFKDANNENK